MLRIDCHAHVWRVADGDPIRILERVPDLRRDFTFDALRARMDEAGVARAVLVSAAQATRETERLLAVADAQPVRVHAVIGYVDPEAPDFAARLDGLRRHPRLAGLRFPLPVIDDPTWITRPAVLASIDALAARGLVAEILAAPVHLAACTAVLSPRPGLRAVIHHCGLPPIAAGAWQPWADLLAALAQRTSAWCKLSGLIDLAPPGADDAAIFPWLDHVLRCFGPTRLVAAVNWPVFRNGIDYRTWWDLLDRHAAHAGLTATARAAITGVNASQLFAQDA